MFKKIIFCFFFFANQSLASESWNGSEGLKRLEESQFKNDFYQLVNFYQPQINPLYCSVASSVIVLNALNYEKIPSQKTGEIINPDGKIFSFKIYSQQGFLNEETDKIKSRKVIEYKSKNSNSEYDPGMNLNDLSQILSNSYHLKTTLISVKKSDQETKENFRQNLKIILNDKEKFLIANFNGKILGQKTDGHFSPIAAYDEESDSVLILDVALHKNQWFWTSVSELVSAMNTKDGDFYRGYLVVENR
ncbi:MAG: hypothetical protein KGP29_03720 [Proteobacteria bacterium]|nr:hypothetical protein [Pseudomonadota bacterium]